LEHLLQGLYGVDAPAMEIDLHAIKSVIQRHLSSQVFGAIPQTQGEARQASTRKRMGREYPSPQPTRDSGRAPWAPPAGFGAEPRRKTNLVHSKRHGTLLVARYRKYYKKCDIIIIFNSS